MPLPEQLASDHDVVGIDNVNDYYNPSLKRYRLAQLAELDSFRFRQLQLEDRQQIEELFGQHDFDAVINLAARAGVRYSAENPFVYLTTNVNGSLNLLESMRRHGVKKYVLASTSSLYAGNAMPFVETMPVNAPISTYAASKKSAELMAHAFHHQYAIDVSVLRFFSVYGPAGRPDMSYFRFIQNIHNGRPITVYGSGDQTRDFTYISDIVQGTILATKDVGYEIFNLGYGRRGISINEMIAKIETLMTKRAIVEYEPAHCTDFDASWADNSKAARLLGWVPSISFDDGLSQCVQWFRDNLPWTSQINCLNENHQTILH